MRLLVCRSTVFVQGNIVNKTYQDAEGNNRSAINIYQCK